MFLFPSLTFMLWMPTKLWSLTTPAFVAIYLISQASGEELIPVWLPRPCMGSILRDQMNLFYSLSYIWYMYVDFNWHFNWLLLYLFIRVWPFSAVIFSIEAAFSPSADFVSIGLGLLRSSASSLLWLHYPCEVCCFSLKGSITSTTCFSKAFLCGQIGTFSLMLGNVFGRPSCIHFSCTIRFRVPIVIQASRLMLFDLIIAIFNLVLVSGTKQDHFTDRSYGSKVT